MSFFSNIFGSHDIAKRVAKPSRDQLDALITAMCIVGLADGELSETELAKLARQIDAAGWANDMLTAQLETMLASALEHARMIVETDDDAACAAELTRVSVELATLEMRKAAFAMAYAVAAVEGEPSEDELAALEALGNAFELPVEQAAEVQALVKAQLAV